MQPNPLHPPDDRQEVQPLKSGRQPRMSGRVARAIRSVHLLGGRCRTEDPGTAPGNGRVVTSDMLGKEMARSRRITGDEAIASMTSGTSTDIPSSKCAVPMRFKYRRLEGRLELKNGITVSTFILTAEVNRKCKKLWETTTRQPARNAEDSGHNP